eukprot:Opistho-1_new@30501
MRLYKDVLGLFCFLFAWAIVLFAEYAAVRKIIVPAFGDSLATYVLSAIYTAIVALMMSAHTRTMLMDPGYVNDNMGMVQGPEWTLCSKCGVYRPPRAHHCRTCGRCVRKMDHHCPWVNTCVGENNQRFFIVFLVYVAIVSVFSLFLVGGYHLYFPCPDCPDASSSRGGYVLGLLLLALVFAIFMVIMLSDQVGAIILDATLIERLPAKPTATEPPVSAPATFEDVQLRHQASAAERNDGGEDGVRASHTSTSAHLESPHPQRRTPRTYSEALHEFMERDHWVWWLWPFAPSRYERAKLGDGHPYARISFV